MYTNDFSITVVQNGSLVKEEDGKFLIEYYVPFSIRVKNKSRVNFGVDVYINGDLLNDNGPYLIQQNSFVDVKTGSDNRTLILVERKFTGEYDGDKNNLENGLLEIKLYKTKEVEYYTNIIEYPVIQPIYTERPIYVGNPFHWTLETTTTTTNNTSMKEINVNYLYNNCESNDFIGKGKKVVPETKRIAWNLEETGTTITLRFKGFQKEKRTCVCGHTITDNMRFCPFCGRKIK